MENRNNELLGNLSPQAIAEYLMDLDDIEEAEYFLHQGSSGQFFGSSNRPYTYSGMAVGYFSNNNVIDNKISIDSASTLPIDSSLIDSKIKVTLDKFYVEKYPGRGEHKILLEFSGKNQLLGVIEPIHFAISVTAQNEQSSAINGAPIFLGVTVGANGLSLEGRSINIGSNTDELLLSALDSGVFKDGLSLLSTAQPVIKPFVSLATAMVKSVASRSKNKPVSSFNLGLDFNSNGASSARLRHGSYIIVQCDEHQWNWNEYYWDSVNQSLRKHQDSSKVKFNYFILGIAPYIDSQP